MPDGFTPGRGRARIWRPPPRATPRPAHALAVRATPVLMHTFVPRAVCHDDECVELAAAPPLTTQRRATDRPHHRRRHPATRHLRWRLPLQARRTATAKLTMQGLSQPTRSTRWPRPCCRSQASRRHRFDAPAEELERRRRVGEVGRHRAGSLHRPAILGRDASLVPGLGPAGSLIPVHDQSAVPIRSAGDGSAGARLDLVAGARSLSVRRAYRVPALCRALGLPSARLRRLARGRTRAGLLIVARAAATTRRGRPRSAEETRARRRTAAARASSTAERSERSKRRRRRCSGLDG